ncbi:MAG: hypothetical protein AAF990_19030 [Bacteroidota bacterium]
MKTALTIALVIFSISFSVAQNISPQVSPRGCKLYYKHSEKLQIEIKTEGGPWLQYYLTRGISDISLQDCGNKRRRLCEKYLRICTPAESSNCQSVRLEGKSRYEVFWNSAIKAWDIRKI